MSEKEKEAPLTFDVAHLPLPIVHSDFCFPPKEIKRLTRDEQIERNLQRALISMSRESFDDEE